MRRGEARVTAIAEGVERVFDDVVPDRADDMHKELAGEFAEGEAAANVAAVEDDRAAIGRHGLAPLRQDLAALAVEQQPKGDVARAIARPIVRRDQPCMQAALVAEEDEVGGEIERVEIAL